MRRSLVAREVNWLVQGDAEGGRSQDALPGEDPAYNSESAAATAVLTGPDELRRHLMSR